MTTTTKIVSVFIAVLVLLLIGAVLVSDYSYWEGTR
jgi:hypothetical protein